MLYLTLRQYQYVVAVADAGSLTDAAARLHVSQPSLSVAITRVEERLGQIIFVRRKGASIVMTPFGHRFADQARGLLRIASEIEQGSDVARPFVLGCFEDIAPWYLAPALERLGTDFPKMAFQGKEDRFSGLANDITEGRVDLAISYDIGIEGHFAHRKIREIAPVAFVANNHPLATQPSVELMQLVDHPLILSSEDLSEGYVRNLFEKLNLQPTVAQKTTSLEMMRSLAAHGVGVGISYSSPPTGISYDGKPLTTVPIATPEAAADIVLIWSRLRKPDPHFSEILETVASI